LAIPDFTAHGLLPPGIHLTDLEEIRNRFSGLGSHLRRGNLFSSLSQLIESASSYGLFRAAIVDGSFVTDKADPSDVDLMLELNPKNFDPRQYQAFIASWDPVKLKASHHLDLYPFIPEMPEGLSGTMDPIDPILITLASGANDMRVFFQTLRAQDAEARGVPHDTLKGILEVPL
jgi:hypothetical protein